MIPKFRAWDKEENKMINWGDLGFFKNKNDEDLRVLDLTYFPPKFKNVKLMQSTGLKDINGTEIYEGDILKTSIKNLVVEWVPKGACWGIGCHYLFHYYETSEVIGNIYENPELLEDN
nr:MAG TPA: YopX protein [Caudoviricetes sp.]